MRLAALTYVYNENVNLKIWRDYYGRNFGEENLYIIDHGSNDGSTSDLGKANKISIPRTEFDDIHKSTALSAMHTALLQSFDCIVVADGDEIIVPDPLKYESLTHYIVQKKPTVMICIGLNVRHILTMEPPLNLSCPILSQRKIASFATPTTKPLISSVPTIWQPGGHQCNIRPCFDSDVFVFHLKLMDYTISMARHGINKENQWSPRAMQSGHGVHHRFEYEKFVSEGFLDPINAYKQDLIFPFEFEEEIKLLRDGVTEINGSYWTGHAAQKYVKIPDRFCSLI